MSTASTCATLLALLTSALCSTAAADSLRQCTAIQTFATRAAIGVEGDVLDLEAELFQVLSDAGASGADASERAIPVSVQPSEDRTCWGPGRGFRVMPSEPLRLENQYRLVMQVQRSGCAVAREEPYYPLHVVDVSAPANELPTPDAPELLMQRCPGRAEYYYFEVASSPAVAPIHTRWRLEVDGALEYCVGEGLATSAVRAVPCAPGTEQKMRLRWVAELPHTGKRFEGAEREVLFVCDMAREVECPEATFVALADASAPSDAARVDAAAESVSRDDTEHREHGCAVTAGAANGAGWSAWCVLAGVLLWRRKQSRTGM